MTAKLSWPKQLEAYCILVYWAFGQSKRCESRSRLSPNNSKALIFGQWELESSIRFLRSNDKFRFRVYLQGPREEIELENLFQMRWRSRCHRSQRWTWSPSGNRHNPSSSALARCQSWEDHRNFPAAGLPNEIAGESERGEREKTSKLWIKTEFICSVANCASPKGGNCCQTGFFVGSCCRKLEPFGNRGRVGCPQSSRRREGFCSKILFSKFRRRRRKKN